MKHTTRLRGFTLIELLITMALAAIMLALAAPAMQKMLANQRLSAAASDFMTTAMQARSAALKYNRRVVAQPVDGATGPWKDGWRIYLDENLDSVFDPADTLVLAREALPDGVTITLSSGTNNMFGYKGSGFLEDTINGSANATWVIRSDGTDRVKYLVLERSGRARLCDPKLMTPCP